MPNEDGDIIIGAELRILPYRQSRMVFKLRTVPASISRFLKRISRIWAIASENLTFSLLGIASAIRFAVIVSRSLAASMTNTSA
jgi:hypothetical protein